MARTTWAYPIPLTVGERDSYDLERQRHDEVLRILEAESDALAQGDVLHFLMSFPVADGHAIYRVTKLKPFTIQHVPVHDAWQIPKAHILGLRIEDALRQQAGRLALGKIFSTPAKEG